MLADRVETNLSVQNNTELFLFSCHVHVLAIWRIWKLMLDLSFLSALKHLSGTLQFKHVAVFVFVICSPTFAFFCVRHFHFVRHYKSSKLPELLVLLR